MWWRRWAPHGPEVELGGGSAAEGVTDIRADGEHAVIFTLASGNADLPYLLSDYHLVILPANDDGSIDWQNGTGSGPYRVVEFQPGIGAELVRHDGWHRADTGAWFDAITMTVLNDPNARQTAIVTGDVDAVTDIDLKTIDLLARAPGVLVDDVPSGTHITMPMFTRSGAVRRCQRAAGAEIRHRPAGNRRQDPVRARHHRQRPADRSDDPLSMPIWSSAATIRTGRDFI